MPDPRERMAKQLLMRGHATMDQILEASFGEWPPKGLDIVGTNNQTVQLMPLMDMVGPSIASQPLGQKLWNIFRAQMMTAGLGSVASERQIGMHRLWGGNSVMGHEAVHILQGDNYYRAREIYGPAAAQEIRKSYNDIQSNVLANELFEKHTSTNFARVIGSQIAAVGTLNYLKTGVEIQARVHQVLMRGYPQWGRLPQNREELWVAMDDVGLNIPKAIQEQLNHSPTIEHTRSIFANKVKAHLYTETTGDINTVQMALTNEGKQVFWEETLPKIYADLIEMYGDRPGRERFGLGKNERVHFRYDASKQIKADTTVEEGVDLYKQALGRKLTGLEQRSLRQYFRSLPTEDVLESAHKLVPRAPKVGPSRGCRGGCPSDR